MKLHHLSLCSVLSVAAISCLLVITTPSSATINSQTGDGSLVIGAFNIQILGVTKIGKVQVVELLVQILRRYDLVLIQEIRDSSETVIKILLDAVNQDLEDRYEMIVSERLGRTVSKEQYAYFYKPSKLTLLGSYVFNDMSGDVFEREPFIVYFESPTTAVDKFAMFGIHIKPSDAVQEINRLVGVYDDFVARYGQKNVIIGGDFNADCRYVSNTALMSSNLRIDDRFRWIIPDDLDTTVAASDCSYDRFVIAGDELIDNIVPGKSGAFYFDEIYGLDQGETKDVSDHYPIEMVIQGNLKPIKPFSTTTSGSITCSGSFRAVVWLCLLVINEEADTAECIVRLVKSLSFVSERCIDEWLNLYMNYRQ